MQASEALHQQALRELRSFLVDEMTVSEVIDHIIEVDGLTPDELEQIDVTQGRRAKMRKLLDYLQKKDIVVFNAMMKGLKANYCSHVVEKLEAKTDFIKQQKQDPRLFDVDPSQILAQPKPMPEPNPGQQDWFQRYPQRFKSCIPNDKFLTLVALRLGNPAGLGGFLSLPYSCSQQCMLDNPHSITDQTVAVLQAWKRSNGRGASMEGLVRALVLGKLLNDEVCAVIRDELGEYAKKPECTVLEKAMIQDILRGKKEVFI